MKRFGIFVTTLMLLNLASWAQKAEVIYFKAELACCQAKVCEALEGDVKSIVEKNFNGETVAFKEIKIADENNKDLVSKYSAKSQTVVIATKKNDTYVDVSDIVRKFSRSKNKVEFEKELIAKINESIK